MDADFWLERWNEGRTHFHQDRVTPLLQKFWPTLSLPAGSQVLVPLCGKSLDMLWLAEQDMRVLGVELSPLALEQFFTDNGLQPTVRQTEQGTHYTAGNIEIICGDMFKVRTETLSACAGVYDRAALIALPESMRGAYVQHVYGQLASQYRGLLITLDYPQHEMEGPPFSVQEAEVQKLYAAHSAVANLYQRDILDKEPKFLRSGVTRLDTVVYRLEGSR